MSEWNGNFTIPPLTKEDIKTLALDMINARTRFEVTDFFTAKIGGVDIAVLESPDVPENVIATPSTIYYFTDKEV